MIYNAIKLEINKKRKIKKVLPSRIKKKKPSIQKVLGEKEINSRVTEFLTIKHYCNL